MLCVPDAFFVPPWLRGLHWGECIKSACPFWAPDLPSSLLGGGDDFTMYYSLRAHPEDPAPASVHCVGLAQGTFAAPTATGPASIAWEDSGEPVICTNVSADPQSARAIDPSVSIDGEGRHWLSFGSFSPGGITVVELNATTGALGNVSDWADLNQKLL